MMICYSLRGIFEYSVLCYYPTVETPREVVIVEHRSEMC